MLWNKVLGQSGTYLVDSLCKILDGVSKLSNQQVFPVKLRLTENDIVILLVVYIRIGRIFWLAVEEIYHHFAHHGSLIN